MRIVDWPPQPEPMLTPLQAFDTMRAFLERFWIEGGKREEEIADLLSSMNRSVWEDRGPGDPAFWGDWLGSIERVLYYDGPPLDDPLESYLTRDKSPN